MRVLECSLELVVNLKREQEFEYSSILMKTFQT